MQKLITIILLIGTISGWSAFFLASRNASKEENISAAEKEAAAPAAKRERKQAKHEVIIIGKDGKPESADAETTGKMRENMISHITEIMESEAQERIAFFTKTLNLNEFQIKRLKEISDEFNAKHKKILARQFESETLYNADDDKAMEEDDRMYGDLDAASLENRITEVLDEKQRAEYEAYRGNLENADAEAYAAMRLAADLRKESLSEAEKNKRFADYAKEALTREKKEDAEVDD